MDMDTNIQWQCVRCPFSNNTTEDPICQKCCALPPYKSPASAPEITVLPRRIQLDYCFTKEEKKEIQAMMERNFEVYSGGMWYVRATPENKAKLISTWNAETSIMQSCFVPLDNECQRRLNGLLHSENPNVEVSMVIKGEKYVFKLNSEYDYKQGIQINTRKNGQRVIAKYGIKMDINGYHFGVSVYNGKKIPSYIFKDFKQVDACGKRMEKIKTAIVNPLLIAGYLHPTKTTIVYIVHIVSKYLN